MAPPETGLAAVIVGVTGSGTTLTSAVPALVLPSEALVTWHLSFSVPTAPALNVTALVPSPPVIVPFTIDHA